MARTVETIGTRITAWRRRRGGMSQKVLADLSGLSGLDRKATRVVVASALNSPSPSSSAHRPPGDPIRGRATAYVRAIRHIPVELGLLVGKVQGFIHLHHGRVIEEQGARSEPG